MAITISSLTAVQGTGSHVKESVVEVSITFSNDNANHTNDIAIELTLDGGTSWHNAMLHTNSTYNGQSKLPGSYTVLVRVRPTIDNNNLSDYDGSGALMRAKVTDNSDGTESTWSQSDPFSLQTHSPTFNGQPTMADYVQPSTSITVDASAHSGADPAYIRLSLDPVTIAEPPQGSLDAYSEPYSWTFPGGVSSGEQQVYARVYDQFYNASESVTVGAVSDPTNQLPWMQREAPDVPTCRILGSTGSQDYTGLKINDDGSFTVQREVLLQLTCSSPIPVTYQVRTTSSVEQYYHVDGNGVETGSLTHPESGVSLTNGLYVVEDEDPISLAATTNQPVVKLTTDRNNPTADDADTDATVQVFIRFTDAAGNQSSASDIIRLNTRLYLTSEKPLRKTEANYQHVLREVKDSGSEVVIPRTMLLADEPIRAWRDIFHPTTHSYPTDADGNFDEVAAIAMGEQSNAEHDAVALDNGAVVYDDEGRPTTVDWTNDGSKDYADLTSNHVSNISHWVIDNTGFGDFQLEFEWFDLDPRVFGPPFNPLSPHRGDVLVLYDATAPGALDTEIDEFGNEKWVLADSTKLTEIWAYTGQSTNVINLTTGQAVGSDAQGGFTTPWIRGTSKVVLVLYTDAAESASGFKLKSGPAYDRQYINYHVDERNGEAWVHKHESLGTARGASDSTAKRMVYDYVDGYIYPDLEDARISFDSHPGGPITVDWSYYTHATPQSLEFLASNDDFVFYQDAPVYVTPANTASADTDKTKLYDADGEGRVPTGVSFDKDRGVLTVTDPAFLAELTDRRLFSDYYHHTYYRLADDGYGDLVFRDPVIVADDTPAFPDYTWADVKIVNEGEAALEEGKVIFTYRGYDTNNDGEVILDPAENGGDDIVDQVLNIERPWDIQRGTREESYEKMAMAFNNNFIWDRHCPKEGGSGQTGDSGATDILQWWRDRSFGDIAARSVGYGRVVWVLGGTSGGSYPATTAGEKRCSLEVSGKYYTSQTS